MRGLSMLVVVVAVVIAMAPGPVSAQPSEAAVWAAAVANDYRIVPNVTYVTTTNWDNRLDLYLPRDSSGPTPTLLYFHGGFWVRGSREASALNLLPYLEMGWAVVNVSYRLGRVSRAPAAVEDSLCALRWAIRNAEEYNLDPDRIVLTGHSAGGHLSLVAAMVPASAGLDRQCPDSEPLRVAAVVNWYGPTDVADLLEGPNQRTLVVEWLASAPDRMEIARRVSPLTYVRAGLPPVLTIHGDADPVVPYQHAVRLHAALDQAGVANELHTVSEGEHGDFSREETRTILETVQRFFRTHGLMAK